jgi:hypothetical protein
MKQSWQLNLALLAAVVALGWWAYFKPAAETAAIRLSTLQAGAASSIRIERSGQPAVALQKKNAMWWIVEPLSAPAEPRQVERLLAVAQAEASARLAADDLARFDLDPPLATLVIDGQSFGFGGVSTATREQYVLTQGAVHTVELRYGAALPADPASLIRRSLFIDGEVPVQFEFADFTLRSRDGKWVLAPQSAELGADDIARWVEQWRQASALRVAVHDQRKPVGEIRIGLKDGRQLTLGILQREPELILLRPDHNLQYTFISATARRLLAPPAVSARP